MKAAETPGNYFVHCSFSTSHAHRKTRCTSHKSGYKSLQIECSLVLRSVRGAQDNCTGCLLKNYHSSANTGSTQFSCFQTAGAAVDGFR